MNLKITWQGASGGLLSHLPQEGAQSPEVSLLTSPELMTEPNSISRSPVTQSMGYQAGWLSGSLPGDS